MRGLMAIMICGNCSLSCNNFVNLTFDQLTSKAKHCCIILLYSSNLKNVQLPLSNPSQFVSFTLC